MQGLLDFADAEVVQDVVRQMRLNPDVQGIIVDVDPRWYLAWQLYSRVGEGSKLWCEFLRGLSDSKSISDFPVWWILQIHSVLGYGLTPPPDFSFHPPGWNGASQSRGQKGPFIIKIILYPGSKMNFSVPQLPYPVVKEMRPPARLAASPRGGNELNSISENGTLGLILSSSSGANYAVSAAHCFQKGDMVDVTDKTGSRQQLGTVVDASKLIPVPAGTLANPFSTPKLYQEEDSAIIEVFGAVSPVPHKIEKIGMVDYVATRGELHTRDYVEFYGMASHLSSGEIGGLAVTYDLQHGSSVYCFEKIFEMRPCSIPYVQVAQNISPVQLGDSGAAIVGYTKNDCGWWGNVLGTDSFMGYATYSEHTYARAARNLPAGASLTLSLGQGAVV